MRWSPHYSQAAVDVLCHQVDRKYVWAIRDAVRELIENPMAAPMRPTEEDTSVYWIAVPGDYVIYFEIIDERQIVRIVDIA